MRKNHISARMKQILAIACAAAIAITSAPVNLAYATEAEPVQEEVNNAQETEGDAPVDPPSDNTASANDEGTTTGGNTDTTTDNNTDTTTDNNTDTTTDNNTDTTTDGNTNTTTDNNTDTTTDGNTNTTTDGNTEKPVNEEDQEVEKKIVIDFGIDENESVLKDGEYTKLVFKASAKDDSSLETAISKVEYALINDKGETEKSGLVSDASIVIEASDLSMTYEKYKLVVTATDADDEETSSEKELKFFYELPIVTEISIDSENSETINNGTAYTKLVFSAKATTGAGVDFDHFEYELKQSESVIVQGSFGKDDNATVDVQTLDDFLSGEYTLTVIAVDKNGQEGSADYNGTLYLFKDVDGPEITYNASHTSSYEIDFDKAKITYTFTVTDESGVSLIEYAIKNADGSTGTINKIEPVVSNSFEYEVTADAKGSVWVKATDIYGTSKELTTKVFVIEDEKPEVDIKLDSADDKYQKEHTFTVTVSDLPEAEYSGIQKVEWVLNNEEENRVDGGVLTGDDIPENLEQLIKSKEWEVVTDDTALNGTYTFKVTATDWCGNPSEKTQAALYDNESPIVTRNNISAASTQNEEGFFVFNKKDMEALGENGVVITLGVTEKYAISDTNWTVSYMLDGEEQTANCTLSPDATLSNLYTATINLKEDGEYTDFKVEGKDEAGNDAISDDSINNLKVKIDTSVPTITVELNDTNKTSHYHKDGTAKVTISSEKIVDSYSIQVVCGDNTKELVGSEINSEEIVVDIDQNTMDEICASKEGEIKLQITATAKNGNVIKTFSGNGMSIETIDDVSTGTYYYDAVSPKLMSVVSTISDPTNPDNQFIVYNDEKQSYVSAKKVTDTYTITEKYIKPGSIKIFYKKGGQNVDDPEYTLRFDETLSAYIMDVKLSLGEGESYSEFTNFKIEAEDLAGNKIELSDTYASSPDIVNAATASDGAVTLDLGKTLDVASPTVEFAATQRTDGNAYSWDAENSIRYYNSNFTGIFTVVDNISLKNAPIVARLYNATVDPEDPNVAYEQFKDVTADTAYTDLDLPENTTEKITIEKEISLDGIYHFYIEGTDKAGNKIVNKEDVVETEMALSEYDHGFISSAKVRDTVKPRVTFAVDLPTDETDELGNPIKKNVFSLLMDNSTVTLKPYDPFQKKSSAIVSYTGDDPSLVSYSYSVVSSVTDKVIEKSNQQGEFEQYQRNTQESDVIAEEEHIVTIEEVHIKDRAGNEQILGDPNDSNKPNKSQPIIFDDTDVKDDFVAPQASVQAIPDITYHNADGRDLFNTTVTLKITIEDPGQNISSSGLRRYTYSLEMDGNEELRETKDDFPGYDPDDPQWDSHLQYIATAEITVDKDNHQSNNIVLKVDAEDWAGNKMQTLYYSFGIDSVGPTITIEYDNNSVRNGKYFNKDRIATVTITDRNINYKDRDDIPGKVFINTQDDAIISSGFDHSDGGGNGANDTWTKTITYNKDGDYTLSFEGTKDALGNDVEDIIFVDGTQAGEAFTIDKTAPIITLWFDNNSYRNHKYFKDNRTATVRFKEHNFYEGGVRIVTQNVSPGDYSHNGDYHETRLPYTVDGDYTITVDCTDLAGNRAQTVKVDEFIIDKTAPTIKVDFDNNSAQNGKYYKDPRNATVTVTDHNFSAADTRIDTQVTPGGFRDESRDIHKANVYYGSDGVYTMYVTSTDLAGNACTQPVRIDEFVIDRTAPVISVTFDNNDAQNGKYYKDPRTATVSIHEHNFRESDVNIAQTADIQQGSVSAPGVGGFGGGGDDHSASINYSQDGNYTIEVNYSDLAGNPAQVVRVDEFVIDQTPPTLKFIMPDELKGISQIFQGDIAPQIEFGDINMTRGMASIELKGMKANSDVLKLLEDSFENYKGTVRYENLKKVRESDDIYTATAVVTDLAGNKVEKTITFSVNRFGSTYDYNKDDFTTKLMGYYFTNAPGDVILREVNVNQLTDHKLTLYKDGDNWVLVEGKDYKFEERQVNGHYEYIYTILAKNFEEEGNYNIIASSKDKAANTNSNSAVKENDGSNEVPLRFAVDKTAPTNLITGVDMSKNKFTESQIVLNIEPQDNMNAVARFRVRVLDRKGNVLQEFEISGKELAEYFEENNGIYQLTVNQNTGWQTIEVLTTDAAGNESVDYSIENNTAYRVLVTPNLFYQYIYRLPLVGATLAIIGGLIFFWLWKRKKDEEEKEAA